MAEPETDMTAEPPSSGFKTETRSRKTWTWRIGVIALGGALLAVIVAVLSTTLARYGIIGKLTGFGWFMQMMYVAGASAILGAVALVLGLARKTGPKWPAFLSLLLSLGLLGAIYALVINPAQSAPPMHDITTDVANPPEFRTLELREDNLVPFQGVEEWRAAHRQNYPEIAPIVVDAPPEQVLARARALAEERGWEIASYNAEMGYLEATAYAGYIRFMDDVIVEVTPVADGSTRVDMRSVSRVGVSDLGYNARRIEEFLGAMRTQTQFQSEVSED